MTNVSTFVRGIIGGVILLSAISCDDDERNIARNVTNYRILSVVVEPPDVSLQDLIEAQTQAIQISVTDVAPEDLRKHQSRTYDWSLCFSVGSVMQFDCLDEDYVVHGSSTEALFEISVDLMTITQLIPPDAFEQFQSEIGESTVVGLGQDGCPHGAGRACNSDGACEPGLTCDGSRCLSPPQTSPLPLVFKVRGTLPDGQVRQAAKVIPLRLYGQPNQNPRLKTISLDDRRLELVRPSQAKCQPIGPLSVELGKIRLSAETNDASAETYRVHDGSRCREVSEQDDLILAWYTTHGDLRNGLSDGRPFENELTLTTTDGPSRIYMVLRDGRGGLDAHCIEFEVGTSQAQQ